MARLGEADHSYSMRLFINSDERVHSYSCQPFMSMDPSLDGLKTLLLLIGIVCQNAVYVLNP